MFLTFQGTRGLKYPVSAATSSNRLVMKDYQTAHTLLKLGWLVFDWEIATSGTLVLFSNVIGDLLVFGLLQSGLQDN